MAEIIKNAQGFVGYDYKEVDANGDLQSVYADSYPSFGWELDGTGTTLKFKRDRKIRNKAELSRLQRQFEAIAGEIQTLEKSKTAGALIIAFTVGLIGTAFLAGATFAFIYANMVAAMVLLAIPGFVGWSLPYFLYNKVTANKTAAVAPLIDSRYDAIYEVCEKANALLAN